jgi:hypothetical protein
MSISRRRFLETATAATATAGVLNAARNEGPGNTPLPTRVLGKTGARVSILAMGCGSRFLMYKDEDAALAALHRAFDQGITYFDTAYSYGNGLSESRVGKAFEGKRDRIWIATKIDDREGDAARKRVEGSLKRLRTDHIDLVHIHALMDEDDLARIEAKDGVLNTFLKMKEEGTIRNVGITSHYNPAVLKTALERHPFDCTQMALNAALVGMKDGAHGMIPNPAIVTSFQTLALPVANRKNMGVLAMKVFAQEALSNEAPPEKLIRYSLSLPVTACVVGMPKPEMIDDNVRIVKAFRPMPKDEMHSFANSISLRNKARIDEMFRHHVDA